MERPPAKKVNVLIPATQIILTMAKSVAPTWIMDPLLSIIQIHVLLNVIQVSAKIQPAENV